MKNNIFDIQFDKKTGFLNKLSLVGDEHNMNWVRDDGKWGCIYHKAYKNGRDTVYDAAELTAFSEDNESAEAVFSNGVIQVIERSSFDKDGNFVQNYKIKNISSSVLFLNEYNFSVEIPFNDEYTYADDCLVHKCHTHIWCGGSSTYVNALKMGVSDNNLGLVVLKGSFESYSVNGCKSNSRGIFLLNLMQKELLCGEEYEIEWVIFGHEGKCDFVNKALKYPPFVDINAEHYTVFKGESIKFKAQTAGETENTRVYSSRGEIAYKICDGDICVDFAPETIGEYRIFIETDSGITWADFLVKESFETIIKKRIDFIVDKQQYNKENSPLDGAYLIYDNKKEHVIFSDTWSDHNACRERIGMALLICRYLQTHENEKYCNSLMKYISFVKREFYNEETGDVYNTIGKNSSFIRLYNAPWVAMLFCEMYNLTKEKQYIDEIMKLFGRYYEMGGSKFYPNGVAMLNIVNTVKEANMPDEYNMLFKMFKVHVDNMVDKQTSYPPHEVNFEQTIVTPASTCISEFAMISGDKSYVAEAKKHIDILERFAGKQPSFHMNEIPIRFWDDFWFGKSRLFGDTFPHYWSCLSARSFNDYYKASGETRYFDMARECMRNCLCLFDDEGRGSAAYLYPYRLNEAYGEKYDEWANDQDFALYFALETGLLDS